MDNQMDQSNQVADANLEQQSAPIQEQAVVTPPQDQNLVDKPVDAQVAQQEQWTPNFKFKSMGQEHEIDEDYRAYIKSAEDEKKIKRLFEQFKGVDKLKEQAENYKKESTTYSEELNNYKQSFGSFEKLIAEGQYKKAFDLFKIPPKVLYQAAMQNLEFDELPQQQKQIYNQLSEQEKYNAMLLQQQQQAMQEIAAMKSQALSQEYAAITSRTDVRPIIEKYEAAYGNGSFKEAVKQRGLALHAMTGRDPSAEQVVGEILNLVKPFMAQPTQPQAVIQQQIEKPVIPAVGGNSSQTPGPKAIRSLEDLKRAAADKLAGRMQ